MVLLIAELVGIDFVFFKIPIPLLMSTAHDRNVWYEEQCRSCRSQQSVGGPQSTCRSSVGSERSNTEAII